MKKCNNDTSRMTKTLKKPCSQLQLDRSPPRQANMSPPIFCASKQCRAPKGTPLRRCSRCRSVGYCSEDCQKAHWSEHKLACTPSFRQEANSRSMEVLASIKTKADNDSYDGIQELVQEAAEIDLDSLQGRRLQQETLQCKQAILSKYDRKPPCEQAEFQAVMDSLSGMSREEMMEHYRKVTGCNL